MSEHDTTDRDTGPATVRTLASAELTGGSFGLVELELRRGGTLPPHVHHGGDQAVLVLEGRLTVAVGADRRRVDARELVFLPRGVAHEVDVVSASARVLVLHVPAGPERLHALRASNDLDPELLLALAAEHGVEILTPPFLPITTTEHQES